MNVPPIATWTVEQRHNAEKYGICRECGEPREAKLRDADGGITIPHVRSSAYAPERETEPSFNGRLGLSPSVPTYTLVCPNGHLQR
jgi:hypothetical protein